MADPKISNHSPMSQKREECVEREKKEGREEKEKPKEKEKLVEKEKLEDEDEDGDKEEEEEEQESDEENTSAENAKAADLIAFRHSPEPFYEVLYDSNSTREQYYLSGEASYYKDLPDCETEEELHRAIQMEEFTMHRIDHDVEVTNRYSQWLSTQLKNGVMVPRTLEEDIWQIPNWISNWSSEDED
ncbi:hypothetical protein FPQ18DRAFT_391079 [Pyronema domesticum]|uniref:Uncharacterized protein n=1 Tax=Pyronema omphalodes (strain CBS 100304) TaxID=1076935 RepID=U4L1N8_PYROM|nr:hypothetical protein FPQ18DRAFT_391079 [Pyronema domesticum]CCX09807.1 Protein of unknown function [Pyronema omphalodes CBS 100304]